MLRTQLGTRIESWSATGKTQFKTDLDKITKVPLDVLRKVVEKIAKTFPACNSIELAALEAEQSSLPNSQALLDAISSFTYIWENTAPDESPLSVVEDLTSLQVLSPDASRVLTGLVQSAEPFRDSARVASEYIRMGSPLFVGLRGTVDLRLRFHKTVQDLATGNLPTTIAGAQRVIMANLEINHPGDRSRVISFLMDENDLSYMKRFVRNMERELELSKNLLAQAEQSNG